jgi:P27 family predicted phage terminase small subunit
MIRPKNTIAGNRIPISSKPPAHLNKIASEVWRDTLESVSAAGYQIDELDSQAFAAFCSAASTIRECDKLLERDGLCVDGGREGMKRHPAASVKNSALTQLRSYASALGLTASSRARLPQEFQPEEINPFDDI